MPREYVKKVLLSAIAFLFYATAMLNYIDAVSLFLSQLGAAKLPIALVIISLLVLLNSIISSSIATRIKSDKIFSGVLIFFLINFLVLVFVPQGTSFFMFYYFVLAGFMIYLQEISLINYSNSLLTPLQAKSYLPLIYSFMSMGVIVGAIFAEPYSRFQSNIGVGWLQMAQVGILLGLVLMTSKIFKREIYMNFEESPKQSIYKNIKDSVDFLYNRGKLYFYLAIAIFLFVGLQITLDFKLKAVLADNFAKDTLTEILGMVFLFRSGLSWLLSAFFARRILFRFGVSNLLIFFPFSILLVTIVGIITQMHYLSVIAMFAVYSISHFVYFGICAAQVLSVVPKNKQQSVYFLLRGMLFAVALIFFSMIMLIFSYDISLEPLLNTGMIIGISIILLYIMFKSKDMYHEELKENLYKDDVYLRDRSIELMAEKVSKDRDEIHLRRLLNMPNVNWCTKSKVLLSLGIIGNYQTIVDLAKILVSNENPRLKSEAIHAISMIINKGKHLNKYPVSKHFLLEAYERVLLGSDPLYVKMDVISSLKYFDLDDVIEFLEKNLNSKNILIKTNAIKTMATFEDRGIIPYIEPFLQSKNLSVLGTTIAALWQFEEMRIVLIPKIGEMLVNKNVSAIKNSLYLLSFIGLTWERDYILRQLEHKNPHIRLQALLTLVQLGEAQRLDDLVKKMLWLTKTDNKNELEFVLSRYRHFSPGTKKLLIRKIQQMKESEAQNFYKAFRDSKYVFKWEEGELSKAV
jgi:HEAT repeat protein